MKKRSKIALIVLLANVALLIAFGATWLSYSALSESLFVQQEAERYGGGAKGFAQVSAFFPADGGITAAAITEPSGSVRTRLEAKLIEQSIEPIRQDGALYADAFSAPVGTNQIKGLRGTTSAVTFAVGGDFFAFHPFRLLSGGYILDDDELSANSIVIDDQTAWKTFGSNDIAGEYVEFNGQMMKIVGVVRLESDKSSAEAFKAAFENTTTPVVFVPYRVFDADGTELKFTTYEYVSHDLFSTYVQGLLKADSALSAATIQSNSHRFEILKTFDVLRNYAKRSMQTNGIKYPYWENAARLVENSLAIKLIWLVALAIIPLLSFFFLIGWLLYNTKGKGKVVADFFGDLLDIYYKWKWRRANAKAAKRLEPVPAGDLDAAALDEPMPYEAPELIIDETEETTEEEAE